MTPRFAVLATDAGARRGSLATPHGVLETPAFFPVGTFGAVRGLAPQELRSVGVQSVLANTYHLHLRPGEALVAELGGLHRFMGFDGPILTDSGGYQIYSLDHLCRRSEDGVTFKSPLDGSERALTPESCIAIQEALGADLIVTLDEFDPIGPETENGAQDRERELMERTLRWAERSQAAHRRHDQLLFGIVQGGGDAGLRRESAERTAAIGFEAFAIGGLGVGETPAQRNRLVESVVASLPVDRIRYLMGLGTPHDLVDAIARGVDIFDCVIPTRNGRHGSAFTDEGTLNLRNARFRSDDAPLEAGCPCATCKGHSRAYLRHLIVSGEALGARLVSLHNVGFYMRLMQAAREAISEGDFEGWRTRFGRRYGPREASGGDRSEGSSDATDKAAYAGS